MSERFPSTDHSFRAKGDSLKNPEKEEPAELLRQCLTEHVVDVDPVWTGSDKHRALVADVPVAAMESRISRCDPSLELGPRFALERGKSVVLVGPNGSGKSTLLDAIMEKRHAHFESGSHGYSRGVHEKKTLRISRLNQEELLKSLETLTASEVLKLVGEHYKNDFPVDWENWEDENATERNTQNQEAQQRIESLIDQVVKLFEADPFLNRKVKELSGGERTKLSLLMVLASEPDVLLLDEPTNHLDLESIAKLTGLFETYKRAGVSVVNVSHVEWFLDMVGEDGTIELSSDKKTRKATQSSSPYRKFKRRERREAVIDGSITWYGSESKKVKGNLFEIAQEVTIPDSPLKKTALPTFHGGDVTILSGKNGTGKTKLMAEMANRHSQILRREKGVQTAYLPQLWPEEVVSGSVQTFFEWAKSQINPHSDILSNRLSKELRSIGFGGERTDMLTEPFSSFSGGEQRLLWFAVASILEGTDALILDEPSNHMDEPTMMKVVEAIRKFPGGVILSTHDLRLMEALEDYAGPTREGRGVRNYIFERKDEISKIRASSESAHAYAKETIARARKRAGRVKVA